MMSPDAALKKCNMATAAAVSGQEWLCTTAKDLPRKCNPAVGIGDKSIAGFPRAAEKYPQNKLPEFEVKPLHANDPLLILHGHSASKLAVHGGEQTS